MTDDDLPYVKANGHSNKNFVVMFSASWCGPCKRSYPLMKKLRAEGYIVYVYVTDNREFRGLNLPAKFKIRAFPTFIIFDKGKEVKRQIGTTSELWFKTNLKTEEDQNKKPEPKPTPDPYDEI